ncbi:hypothetical protein RI844_00075 [Thalassotalea fonticola]|uniref:DUF2937 family protein n=1 Tax=Thalassotalea fonticola TaxID=3065649 RepID=A0ABZ0GPU0_9GAMM|nr:hypothetical protein RI844_00075 [Colwelliaceae bacterium S1-1]
MEVKRSYFGLINETLTLGLRSTFRIDWGMVRNFGELQILSRASYLMLILVPLLAGLWPTVTTLVNQHNQTLNHATDKFDLASRQILLYKAELPDSKIIEPFKETLDSVNNELLHVKKSVENQSIKTKTLPSVWALSFLASLLAVIAQVIYQLAAPAIVRNSSMREYINGIIDDEMKIHGNGQEMDPMAIRELIEKTAEEYQSASRSNLLIALLSLFIYISSIFVIGYIIFDQTQKVFVAAGWL